MDETWDIAGLLAGITESSEEIHQAAQKGIGLWGEHVKEEATRIVPIEEGNLERSAAVEQDGDTVAVGFGQGDAAAYAVRQHEELGWVHDAGRQAKYLEQPLMASSDAGLRIVQATIQGEL